MATTLALHQFPRFRADFRSSPDRQAQRCFQARLGKDVRCSDTCTLPAAVTIAQVPLQDRQWDLNVHLVSANYRTGTYRT